jgi:hypothetical protein
MASFHPRVKSPRINVQALLEDCAHAVSRSFELGLPLFNAVVLDIAILVSLPDCALWLSLDFRCGSRRSSASTTAYAAVHFGIGYMKQWLDP